VDEKRRKLSAVEAAGEAGFGPPGWGGVDVNRLLLIGIDWCQKFWKYLGAL
jgi:hypothetical protein